RAWRAAAMWRTSWLSREVICLPIVMGLIVAYWLLQFLNLDTVIFILPNTFPVMLSTLIGLFAFFAVLILFVCTAMIYTCLKFLRQWHHPLTVVNFTFMGLASGFTLATVVSAAGSGDYFNYFANTAITLTIIALLTRFLSIQRNRNLRSPSSLQSAIGIHHPNIRQLAQGAMGGSFNTRAFIHQYGATVVLLARRFLLLSGFILPVILLLLADETSVIFCGFAFMLQMAGFMVERWYFFIEAEHPQNIYYQMIS
ncbi:MAG: DmsC/YnfH family molybdoenzyme membrane anchor subunit, partial [Pseudomonadota bacterium]